MQALQQLLGLVAGITVACMATRIIFLKLLELERTALRGHWSIPFRLVLCSNELSLTF